MSTLSQTQKSVRIVERDPITGKEVNGFILTTTTSTSTAIADAIAPIDARDGSDDSQTLDKDNYQSRSSSRLDPLPRQKEDRLQVKPGVLRAFFVSPRTVLGEYLLPLFLPHGYPHTVTPDYTPYQIYDSCQAFASTIAGLLSSRAVLQSLGLDENSSNDSSTATYATLISIAQATISNLSTIFFAHYASRRVARDVKFYRFLADIVNDMAFLIDCLSPSLPRHLRVPALCLSAACRAVCGVAGGSSKAVLSAHFAVNGNVGELNAKDGSQETVINLVGMWTGGVVVSKVSSMWATWCWLLALLGLHLGLNYCAVRCVRLTSLNGHRAGQVLEHLCRHNLCPSVDSVGRDEGVFERNDQLTGLHGGRIGHIQMGINIARFMHVLGARTMAGSGAVVAEHETLHVLLDIFREERYVAWFDVKSQTACVLLKVAATADDQLKAWCHCIRLGSVMTSVAHASHSDTLKQVSKTLRGNSSSWPQYQKMITAGGWDIDASSVETLSAPRISFS